MILTFALAPQTKANQDSSPEGEERHFTITGYYSPLPNQDFYITGSYEAEIRLNGRGIQGADGTPVYPGMIAAPKSYPFGTKICIPGWGCGTVHDRGGAIVEKGKRKLARHDRLDLWMGYGEEGLRRALAWGVPSIKCNLYEVGTNIKDSVNFQIPQPLSELIDLPNLPVFHENLGHTDMGEAVVELQKALKTLGFYSGEADGIFDFDTKEAVFTFQKRYFILDHITDRGAGSFGPKTRQKMTDELHRFNVQQKLKETWESFHFEENIKFKEKSTAALKLQEMLIQEEFLFTAPTGYFGNKTQNALINFQLAHGLIKNRNQLGAGRVGPKTTQKLNELIAAKKESLTSEKNAILAYQKKHSSLAYYAGLSRPSSRVAQK